MMTLSALRFSSTPPSTGPSSPKPPDVVVQSTQKLQQQVTAGRHQWIVDEPTHAGGDDAGPDPYKMLLAALGACTSMTIQIAAKMRNLPVTGVRVELSHRKIDAQNCTDCTTQTGKVDMIDRKITIDGPLNAQQLDYLKRVAQKCPVHKTLMGEIKVQDTLQHNPPQQP